MTKIEVQVEYDYSLDLKYNPFTGTWQVVPF